MAARYAGVVVVLLEYRIIHPPTVHQGLTTPGQSALTMSRQLRKQQHDIENIKDLTAHQRRVIGHLRTGTFHRFHADYKLRAQRYRNKFRTPAQQLTFRHSETNRMRNWRQIKITRTPPSTESLARNNKYQRLKAALGCPWCRGCRRQ